MEQTKQLYGIVVRADGTVPFDEGVDPATKADMLLYLISQGYQVSPIKDTNHVQLTDFIPSKGKLETALPVMADTSVVAEPIQISK